MPQVADDGHDCLLDGHSDCSPHHSVCRTDGHYRQRHQPTGHFAAHRCGRRGSSHFGPHGCASSDL